MKKLCCLIVFTFILTACNSSEMSITEIQNIPNKVQENINPDYQLQWINNIDKNASYIIFQSIDNVTPDLEVVDNILNIKLDSTDQKNNELKMYVYKLNRGDAEFDTINVKVNGQDTPLDSLTGF